jgi:transcriptional regulator with PAS, ATPase and Fis domain
LRDRLIGASRVIGDVRDTIARVAPLPTSVLLTGESGTGKEVAARSLHTLSDRVDKPFVPVNCAAIPANMIETELFGHIKGAFTGAENSREGLFTHAQGGTLFLDEIGEMPLATQSKLLRVIEDRRVRPVGSEREVPVDLRFVFATNADLQKEVERGRFRADLFYRINVMQLYLPPLRDRGNDVQELADLFMQKLSQQLGMPTGADRRAGARGDGALRLAGECARAAQPDRALADPGEIPRRFPRWWPQPAGRFGRRDAGRRRAAAYSGGAGRNGRQPR